MRPPAAGKPKLIKASFRQRRGTFLSGIRAEAGCLKRTAEGLRVHALHSEEARLPGVHLALLLAGDIRNINLPDLIRGDRRGKVPA